MHMQQKDPSKPKKPSNKGMPKTIPNINRCYLTGLAL